MTCSCSPPAGGSVRLEEFFPYVMPYVLGIPDEVAVQAIRESAIELARLSQALRRHVTIETLPDVPDYQIDLEDDYVVLGILDVALFGSRLAALNRVPVDERSWQRPSFFFEPPRELRVFPSPSRPSECGIEANVTVAPGQDTCEVDRLFYDQYARTVGDGAVSRIMMMKGGPWYDPVVAQRFGRAFMLGAADAKSAANRSYSAGPTIMRARRWV